MSLLGEKAKAFGNSWLILDKAGDGVTRFGAQASVFSFKNHLETESHVGVFQEPLRGQKARGVKCKIKTLWKDKYPQFHNARHPNYAWLFVFQGNSPVCADLCPGGGMAPLMSQQQLNPH